MFFEFILIQWDFLSSSYQVFAVKMKQSFFLFVIFFFPLRLDSRL